jgi:CheY-like chemotaxis protein
LLTLPLLLSAAEANSCPAVPHDQKIYTNEAGMRLHAMVIDGNENMRALLRGLLQHVGITSVEFSDGSAALAQIATVKPDVILTDLAMTPMDGLAFARELRQSPDDAIRHIPIIMVTGQTERRHIEAARDHGVNEILAKPVTAAGLYQRIEAILRRPRPYVENQTYFGPDRRRRNATHQGADRRGDSSAPAADKPS